MNQRLPALDLDAGAVHGSVRAQAYAALRAAIVSLRIEPGHPVSENDLAERLGVSRTPVREAIIRLAGEGLVEVYPQRGSAVAWLCEQRAREAQFVREALERAALPDACAKLDAAGRERLELLLAEQREAHAAGDVARFLAADAALHRAVVELGGHDQAWEVIDAAKGHLDRLLWLSVPTPERLEAQLAEHAAIVAAVVRGDHAAADAALTVHLRRVLAQLPALARQHPTLFGAGAPSRSRAGAKTSGSTLTRRAHRR